MSLEFYDYRTDVRNVVIRPEIRSRFMQIPAGATTGSHTHDLGIEVFIVMEGTIEFDVAGRVATLGPGQMCVAYQDEPHTLRVVGDEPATIYLSVTPHVEPTHTSWDERGQRKPARYGNSTAAERAQRTEQSESSNRLLDRLDSAMRAFSEAVAEAETAQQLASVELRQALATGDKPGAKDVVDAMANRIYQTYRGLGEMVVIWNELATEVTE